MHLKKVLLFLILSLVFATVHYFALAASLYWYLWWFDIVMHFWGGVLLGLGVHSITSFTFVKLEPTLKLVLITLVIATGTWEIFEWFAGLYEPATHLRDTAKDVIVGFSGGLLAHAVLSRYTMK